LVSKISDFGISKTENDSQSKTMQVGTSLYMALEVVLSKNYNKNCDIFSFAIIMYQILTLKINNIYDEEEKKEKKNNEIELKQSLINNDSIDEMNDNNIILNVEFKVANNPNYRPKIPLKYLEKKKYFEFVGLMKRCWKHDPKERLGFNEITMTLQEIQEKIKKK
jgi:serine/threonine protein kinase